MNILRNCTREWTEIDPAAVVNTNFSYHHNQRDLSGHSLQARATRVRSPTPSEDDERQGGGRTIEKVQTLCQERKTSCTTKAACIPHWWGGRPGSVQQPWLLLGSPSLACWRMTLNDKVVNGIFCVKCMLRLLKQPILTHQTEEMVAESFGDGTSRWT